MALNKPSKSPSLFKKRLGNGLVAPSPPLPSSAASYLSALSQADAHARARSVSPTSTPALSLSSSVTSSSEDTILHENDDNPSLLTSNTDGLLYPSHPPTSEQVFTTVHTEFGHCANQQYRTVSQHKPGSLPVHVEQDPPYYILLSTYISYLILICLGHVRDFVGKRFHPSSYHHLMPRDVSNLSFIVRTQNRLRFYRVMLPSTLILILSTPEGSKHVWTNASPSPLPASQAVPSCS